MPTRKKTSKPKSSKKSIKKVARSSSALTIDVDQLPKPVAMGAIKAISLLVGGALAIPLAGLRRVSQKIEDGTNARTQLSRALAMAAGDAAVADEALVDRTLRTLLGDAVQKQKQRERVAQAAVSTLANEATPNEQTQEPDSDWMSSFIRFAENASTERTQDLWGRVLAGEIRKPGAFSLATMRFLAELDKPIAEDFEILVKHVVNFVVHTNDERRSGEFWQRMMRLQESGLVNGAEGTLHRTLAIPADGTLRLLGFEHALHIDGEPNASKASGMFGVEIVQLTRVARELMQLLPPPEFERAEFRRLCKYLKNPPCSKAVLGKVNRGEKGYDLTEVEEIEIAKE